jgi:hypothetical protein
MDVDGVRDYLARGGGRRLMFCTEWIDEFLTRRSAVADADR